MGEADVAVGEGGVGGGEGEGWGVDYGHVGLVVEMKGGCDQRLSRTTTSLCGRESELLLALCGGGRSRGCNGGRVSIAEVEFELKLRSCMCPRMDSQHLHDSSQYDQFTSKDSCDNELFR